MVTGITMLYTLEPGIEINTGILVLKVMKW